MPPTATSMATGENVAQIAISQFSGIPYSESGDNVTGPKSGWLADCSYIVQQAYAKLGISLGRTTYDQVTQGVSVGKNLSNALPGDVIFYNNGVGRQPGHEAMYLGNGVIFQASHPGVLSGVSGPGSASELPIMDIRRYVDPGTGQPLVASNGSFGSNLSSGAAATGAQLTSFTGTLSNAHFWREVLGVMIMLAGGGVGVVGLTVLFKGDAGRIGGMIARII